MNNRSQTSKNILFAILAIIIIGVGALATWLVMDAIQQDQAREATPNSQPAVTPEEQKPPTNEAKTREFTSPKGVKIQINDWREDMMVSSPLTITGEVPGNWSFEASFPVSLTDSNGTILAEEPAQLEGVWMTTDNVPFSVTLDFNEPMDEKDGTLILRKDNPSGLPENDDAIEIPVRYQ